MFAKDPKTGVVHNLNDAELKSTLALRERAKREKELIAEMDYMKLELTAIKALLTDFIPKGVADGSISS